MHFSYVGLIRLSLMIPHPQRREATRMKNYGRPREAAMREMRDGWRRRLSVLAIYSWLQVWAGSLMARDKERGAVAVEYAVVLGVVVVAVVGALIAASPSIEDAIGAAIQKLIDFINGSGGGGGGGGTP